VADESLVPFADTRVFPRLKRGADEPKRLAGVSVVKCLEEAVCRRARLRIAEFRNLIAQGVLEVLLSHIRRSRPPALLFLGCRRTGFVLAGIFFFPRHAIGAGQSAIALIRDLVC
jgi:hypothetical protein